MDSDFFWRSLGGGALITAVLTLVRLIFDYAVYRGHQRDAGARLERILQDRLLEADRRLERSDAELSDERVRSAALERELTCLRQAYDLLKLEYATYVQAADAQRSPR